LFFGSSTAEAVSAATNNGAWNNDHTSAMQAYRPFHERGAKAEAGVGAGVFAFTIYSGGGADAAGTHRTILSGY
jgi:hypothetical protein